MLVSVVVVVVAAVIVVVVVGAVVVAVSVAILAPSEQERCVSIGRRCTSFLSSARAQRLWSRGVKEALQARSQLLQSAVATGDASQLYDQRGEAVREVALPLLQRPRRDDDEQARAAADDLRELLWQRRQVRDSLAASAS